MKKDAILEKELREIEISEKRKDKIAITLIVLAVLLITTLIVLDYVSTAGQKRYIKDDINISIYEIDEAWPQENIIPEFEVSEDGVIKVEITKGYEANVFKNLFEPSALKIKKGSTIEWHSLDNRRHRISCYYLIDNWRIFFSENFYPGETVSYTFNRRGRHLCVDAIYGARSYIFVK